MRGTHETRFGRVLSLSFAGRDRILTRFRRNLKSRRKQRPGCPQHRKICGASSGLVIGTRPGTEGAALPLAGRGGYLATALSKWQSHVPRADRILDVNAQTLTLGRLTCRVIDDLPAGKPPEFIVVLCHGYGAPGTDLVPFGPELLEHSPALAERVQFLFPEAPLDLEDMGMPGGRAWWHLNMRKLQMAVATGEIRDLRAEQPEGLEFARQRLLALIAEWSEQTGIPLSRFVLGGFSQGAMLATDVALHLDETPGGLIVLSGTLLNEAVWRKLAPRRAGLSVLQSHGKDDPLLPYICAELLRDMLGEAGAKLEFVSFRGGHGIPREVFDKVASTLERLCQTMTQTSEAKD